MNTNPTRTTAAPTNTAPAVKRNGDKHISNAPTATVIIISMKLDTTSTGLPTVSETNCPTNGILQANAISRITTIIVISVLSSFLFILVELEKRGLHVTEKRTVTGK
jgi:hypothetical protein